MLLKKKFIGPEETQALSGSDNSILSLVKLVWEINLEIFRDKSTYKNRFIKNYVLDPKSDVDNE